MGCLIKVEESLVNKIHLDNVKHYFLINHRIFLYIVGEITFASISNGFS